MARFTEPNKVSLWRGRGENKVYKTLFIEIGRDAWRVGQTEEYGLGFAAWVAPDPNSRDYYYPRYS
jgi:hypothetical protein